MPQFVYDALKDQRKGTGNNTFMFCNREGNPLIHNNMTKRAWHPLLIHLALGRTIPG